MKFLYSLDVLVNPICIVFFFAIRKNMLWVFFWVVSNCWMLLDNSFADPGRGQVK